MNADVKVSTIISADDHVIDGLNNLLVQLSPSESVDVNRLEKIIGSEISTIIVAKIDEKIVGMATVNIIQKLTSNKAELEDFVVDENQRGKGIAKILWNAVVEWANDNGAKYLEFTSRPSREAAQNFYKKMGAEIRETNFFRYKV